MRSRFPFLYVVLLSGAAAALLLILNTGSQRRILPSSAISGDRVAVVDITGVLTSSHDVSRGASSARSIVEQLDQYGEDDAVRALVLRIDSPGGTVVAAQEVFAAVNRLREEKAKVVVVSMADIAASGGYYIACSADRILANPGTITGSIGGIIEFPNMEELFGKIGVKSYTIKSGEFKDTGSALREMTDRERAVLQALIDDVFGQFVQAVQESRGMTPEKVRELADGRIFTGKQAQELGLIDQIGDMTDAIRAAADLAGIEGEPEIVREKKKIRFWDILEGNARAWFPVPGRTSARLLYLWK
jgi:protease-4